MDCGDLLTAGLRDFTTAKRVSHSAGGIVPWGTKDVRVPTVGGWKMMGSPLIAIEPLTQWRQ